MNITTDKINPTPEQKTACDVNSDGECNAADGSQIMCYGAYQDWNKCANSHSRSAQSRHVQNQPVEVAIGQIR